MHTDANTDADAVSGMIAAARVLESRLEDEDLHPGERKSCADV